MCSEVSMNTSTFMFLNRIFCFNTFAHLWIIPFQIQVAQMERCAKVSVHLFALRDSMNALWTTIPVAAQCPPPAPVAMKLAQNLMIGGGAPSPLSPLATRASRPVPMVQTIGAVTWGSLAYQPCHHALFHRCLHQPCLEIGYLFLSSNTQRLNSFDMICTPHSSLIMHSILTWNLLHLYVIFMLLE